MIMDKKLIKFLKAYSDYLGWGTKLTWKQICWKLCEEQLYSPEHGREFLLIAFGWIWGKQRGTMPYISANCLCSLLKATLDEIYKEVAIQYNW